MDSIKKTTALLLTCLLLIVLVPGCGKSVPADAAVLESALSGAGYRVVSYGQNDTMLRDLENEMLSALDGKALSGSLKSYLYATDPDSGEVAAEIFVFEQSGDARWLYDHFKDGEQFEKNVSAVKRSGTVVYMGYLSALQIVEAAS